MKVLWKEWQAHPEVPDATYKRFLRYPPARTLEGPLAENAAWAREWYAEHGRPWSAGVQVDGVWRERLRGHVSEGETVVLVAASAGPEAEAEAARRWEADEPDRYFFLHCFAAAVVDELLATARRRLGATEHRCPGYLGWAVEENIPLRNVLNEVSALAGPLDVLNTGMLQPKLSQIAVCGTALNLLGS